MKQYGSSIRRIRIRNLSVCVVVLLVGSLLAAAQHEAIIYSFGVKAGDGLKPGGGLIADAAGNLYGITFAGGANNAGTIYELSPPVGNGPWTEAVLYSFTGGEDGGNPGGNLVFDAAGNLYGVADIGGDSKCPLGGCGTIFELSPPSAPGGNWTQTTLYAFIGGSDGAQPNWGVVFDPAGNLYGTTIYGGVSACAGPPAGCGTIFELSPPSAPGGSWTEAVLYRFTGGLDGDAPEAPVTLDNAGNLYGTTVSGGRVECDFAPCGTLFRLAPSHGGVWTETVIHNFGSVLNDGVSPQFAALLVTDSGAIVGTTPEGGDYGSGTVFGMLPPSRPDGHWSYALLYSFDAGGVGLDGGDPQAGVIRANGALYGTTEGGGSDALGTVFQLTPTNKIAVWNETALYSFKGAPNDGFNPMSAVLLHGNALFGTTQGGGTANTGTVFEIRH